MGLASPNRSTAVHDLGSRIILFSGIISAIQKLSVLAMALHSD